MNLLFSKIYNKSKVMEDKPTFIGVVAGIKFYEHPKFGDESPLIAVVGEKCGLSTYWELPTLEELGYHAQ